MSTPVLLDRSHAWGYHSPYDFMIYTTNIGRADPSFKKLIHFKNCLNGASILLSPLVGVIRLITAVWKMIQLGKSDQKQKYYNLKAAKNFWKMEAMRGVLEILGLGILLGTIVDGYMTYKPQLRV